MDISQQDNTQQPISDDQELAKALAGVLPGDSDETSPDNTLTSGLNFEETNEDPLAASAAASVPVAEAPADAPAPATSDPIADFTPPADPAPVESTAPEAPASPLQGFSMPTPTALSTPDESNAPLDDIKLTALKELRPLIDKVDLPADEKFDTYLMLLRSTDDSTLIAPAHAAAQAIGDEKRKAEALLEIIKEIDYLSRKDQPTV